MKKINVLGIDLAKQVFQVHGVDEQGHRSLSKRLRRASLGTSWRSCRRA